MQRCTQLWWLICMHSYVSRKTLMCSYVERALVEGEISAGKGREQVSTCATKIRLRVFCAFGQILVGECLPQTLLWERSSYVTWFAFRSGTESESFFLTPWPIFFLKHGARPFVYNAMIIMFSEEVQFDLSPLAVISDPGRSSWFHTVEHLFFDRSLQ